MVLKDRPVKASHTLASSGLNFAESPEIAIAKYVLAVLCCGSGRLAMA